MTVKKCIMLTDNTKIKCMYTENNSIYNQDFSPKRNKFFHQFERCRKKFVYKTLYVHSNSKR